jgi:hypothetical protein
LVLTVLGPSLRLTLGCYKHTLLQCMWNIISQVCVNIHNHTQRNTSPLYTTWWLVSALKVSHHEDHENVYINYVYHKVEEYCVCWNILFIYILMYFYCKRIRSPTLGYVEFLYTFSCSCLMAWWWPTFRAKSRCQVIRNCKPTCYVWVWMLIYTCESFLTPCSLHTCSVKTRIGKTETWGPFHMMLSSQYEIILILLHEFS